MPGRWEHFEHGADVGVRGLGATKAEAWGEGVDAARHRPAVEVKGATYTLLRVAPDNGGWLAQTVVDV